MAPKKRDPKNLQLTGTNIKKSMKGGKAYYYYIMPDGSHEPLSHGDEAVSIETAIALNNYYRQSGNIVGKIINAPPRVTSKNPPLLEVLEMFEREWLPAQNYSKAVFKVRVQKINLYRKTWPHKLIGEMDTFTIAQFLRGFSPAAAIQHRGALEPLFRFAASQGYETCRPMIDIERRKPEKRKRARHTWEGYKAIYDASPQWLKNACDAALYTLQRRGDLVSINIKEQIDLESKTIRILQQKSRNYDKPVFIDIGMGDELFKAVMASVKSDVPCPYLVHCRPARITEEARKAKPHVFAVTPDYLTKAYVKVRDSVGIYNHLPKIERPGFHSIRALGIWLYGKAGYPDEYIMALAGHATEKMKAHYSEGHEKPKPVKVSAGLSMSAVDLSGVNWETDLSASLKSLVNSGDD